MDKDIETRIMNKKSGNCECPVCGKLQDGCKQQPFTVWYKTIKEKRGHNIPVCSMECAKKYIETL